MKDLQVFEHSGIRVMTTEQLADAYGCDPQHIKQNFNNNKERFTEGTHYFRLEGADLKGFKRQVEKFDLPVSKFASAIYLWTKRGAARHCKMLGTNRAWDVFEELEESYFNPMRNMTPEEFLLYSAQRLVEQAKAIKEANARIDKVDERLRGVSRDIAVRLGRKASAMSRKQGYHIGKEYDAKYGVVNTYHVDVLQEVFRR